MENEFISTTQAAKLLGISRVAVFKKVKSGEIKAKKVGRNFVIPKSEFSEILESTIKEEKRFEIEKAVKKTVKEYGETLKLLGKE